MFRPCKWAIIRLFVPSNSYCIVNLLVLRTTWWWPTYKAETCSCFILRSVTYYIVILSDKLLCFFTACICEYTYNFIHCTLSSSFQCIWSIRNWSLAFISLERTGKSEKNVNGVKHLCSYTWQHFCFLTSIKYTIRCKISTTL